MPATGRARRRRTPSRARLARDATVAKAKTIKASTAEAIIAKAKAAEAAADAGQPIRHETGALAEQIGLAALDLAKRANGAGLTTLGFLLERAALEAGAEAAARTWPTDAARN